MHVATYSTKPARSYETHPLKNSFRNWLEPIPADNDHLVELVHHLRYKVYCVENSFESPLEHPEGLEIDRFDRRSAHSLLIDRVDGDPIGTVRLIFPDKSAPDDSFPIQQLCSHPLLSDRRLLLTKTAAEISRFAVTRTFRSKSATDNSNKSPKASGETVDRRELAPLITLGLMKAVLKMSAEHGITDLFAVMEPSLLRLLSRFGIYFRPLGSLVEYHGLRQPCHARVVDLVDKCWREAPDVWNFVTDGGSFPKQNKCHYHIIG